MTAQEITEESLTNLFKHSDKAFHDIKNSTLESNSPEKQEQVLRCVAGFEQVTALVSSASVFSPNEAVEELPTSSLPLLSLPARLGQLTLLRHGLSAPGPGSEALKAGSEEWRSDRKQLLGMARLYFRDFLTRCRQYEVTSYELPPDEGASALPTPPPPGRPTPQQLQAMGREREQRIRRLREKKEREERLRAGREGVYERDEEAQREYFMDVLANDVDDSVEGLSDISRELGMLDRLPAPSSEPKPAPANRPMGTFLIARDAAQKAVYGLGYPSLPVMSVDEFYEKRLQEGWGPGAAASAPPPAPRPEDLVDRSREEEDEARGRDSLRARDEYRDTHRTGWGNTHNRS